MSLETSFANIWHTQFFFYQSYHYVIAWQYRFLKLRFVFCIGDLNSFRKRIKEYSYLQRLSLFANLSKELTIGHKTCLVLDLSGVLVFVDFIYSLNSIKEESQITATQNCSFNFHKIG